MDRNLTENNQTDKSCNLDLNLDHYARNSFNLDSPDLFSRTSKEIKKEMDVDDNEDLFGEEIGESQLDGDDHVSIYIYYISIYEHRHIVVICFMFT